MRRPRPALDAAGLERNLRLFPWHEALAGASVYLPVFVLFTRDNFGVSGALQIASLTYLFIVILEVPSGWMSDWLGRVPTLRLAAMGFVIGPSCFLLGGDRFLVIVIGQFFVSAGYAFISGTDVSFHYDSLEALGRETEYAQRQAKVAALSYSARAVSAVIGGLLGYVDLRLAFVGALVLALAQMSVTWAFREPVVDGAIPADALLRQIRSCLSYLHDGFMAWIFFYGIALVVLEHVAFTLMQPWLTEALGRSPDELGATPIVSGALFAVVAFVGAGSARASAPLVGRFGTIATLIGLAVVSAVIVTGMALSFAVVLIALTVFRSVQGAAAPVVISAAVAPRTEKRHRATLLSINSLAGRLVYGSLLLALAVDIDDTPRPFLQTTAVISWVLIAVLVATGAWANRRS